MDSVLSLLSKDVAANLKNVDQYFSLIYKYALLVSLRSQCSVFLLDIFFVALFKSMISIILCAFIMSGACLE